MSKCKQAKTLTRSKCNSHVYVMPADKNTTIGMREIVFIHYFHCEKNESLNRTENNLFKIVSSQNVAYN